MSVNISAPATLSTPGETYIATADFSASGTALIITGAGIVLNLNGKTVTYGTGGAAHSYGVDIRAANVEVKGDAVAGGALTQSAGNTAEHCHAIYSSGVANTAGPLIHDLTINTHSAGSRGIYIAYGGLGIQIYSCVFNTSNTVVSLTDEGCPAIQLWLAQYGASASHALIHHNTINGAQRGVNLVGQYGTPSQCPTYVDIYSNEIYPLAPAVYAKISAGVHLYAATYCRVFSNTITTSHGRGIKVQYHSDYNEVYGNTIDVSDDQADYYNNVFGIRVRHGCSYNKIHDNTVIARSANNNIVKAFQLGDESTVQGSGIPTYNEIYDNTFDLRWATDINVNRVAVVFGYTGAGNTFHDNAIISNSIAIEYLDPPLAPVVLTNNSISKGSSPHASWRTFFIWGQSGTPGGPHTVLDAVCGAGVLLNNVQWGSNGGINHIHWTATVSVKDGAGAAVSGAAVTIKDKTGLVVYSGTTGVAGTAAASVRQYVQTTAGGVVADGPHTIKATKAGYTDVSASVTISAKQTVNMVLVSTSPGNPTANAGPDQTIAAGGSALLTGSASGGVAPHTYSWSPATGLSSTVIAQPTASPGATTVYTLTVTDSASPGLTATDTVTVTVASAVVAEAGPAKSIVSGGSAILQGAGSGGVGPYTHAWTPVTGLTDPTAAQPTASPTTTTTYTLTVTDDIDQTDTDTVTVTVAAALAVSAGADKNIIAGGSTNLSGSASGGTAPYTYAWTPTTGLSNAAIANPSATPSVTTTYTLTVTDDAPATASDSVIVTVAPVLVASAGADKTISKGGNCTLQGWASGGTPGYTYSWSPTTQLSNPLIAQPIATPLATTTYTLTVRDSLGQTATDAVKVTVSKPPKAHGGGLKVIALGASTSLAGSAEDGTAPYVFSWSPSTGLDDPAIAAPTVTPDTTTTYILTVTDASAATATDAVVVTVVVPVVAEAGSAVTIGAGNSVVLDGSASGGTGNYTYLWSPIDGLNDPTEAMPLCTSDRTRTYTLTVTDDLGQTDTDTVIVTITGGEPGMSEMNLAHVQYQIDDKATGLGLTVTITAYPVGSLTSSGGLIGSPVACTIYEDQAGAVVAANPHEATEGEVDFYVAASAVDLLGTGDNIIAFAILDVQAIAGLDHAGILEPPKWIDGIGLIANNFDGADIGEKVNAALAAAGAVYGATIWIKEGLYESTTPIVVSRSRVKIKGMGRQSTEIRFTGASGSAMVIGAAGEAATLHQWVEVEGLCLKIEDAATPHANVSPALQLINARFCTFTNCEFESNNSLESLAQDGVVVTSDMATGCYNNSFINCHFGAAGRHSLNVKTEATGEADTFCNYIALLNCTGYTQRKDDIDGVTPRCVFIGAGDASHVCGNNALTNFYLETDNGDPAMDCGGLEIARANYTRFVGMLDGYQDGEILTITADAEDTSVQILHIDGEYTDAGTDSEITFGWAANATDGLMQHPWPVVMTKTLEVTGDTTLNGAIAGAAADPVVMNHRHAVTTAEVNGGHTLVAVPAGYKFRLVDCKVVATGGAITGLTTLDLLCGSSKLVTFAQTNLTQSVVLDTSSTGATVLADGVGFDAQADGADITVGKTGGSMATATGVTILIDYVLEPA